MSFCTKEYADNTAIITQYTKSIVKIIQKSHFGQIYSKNRQNRLAFLCKSDIILYSKSLVVHVRNI